MNYRALSVQTETVFSQLTSKCSCPPFRPVDVTECMFSDGLKSADSQRVFRQSEVKTCLAPLTLPVEVTEQNNPSTNKQRGNPFLRQYRRLVIIGIQ